jgi:peptidoglycan L-alanyl-D-glutamate endopeptidase CwlK
MFWNKKPKYKFSKESLANLKTCDKRLRKLFNEVIKHFDCSIIGGYRSDSEQEYYFKKGLTKLRGGESKHNLQPSQAIDVCPYPIDWSNHKRYILFAGYVKGIASQMNIKIRWGGDWDSDNIMKDQTFNDLPHFQLED